MDQAALVEALQKECPSRWPSIWGAVYTHRSACLQRLREALDQLLTDPRLTRRALREQLAAVLQEIEETGP